MFWVLSRTPSRGSSEPVSRPPSRWNITRHTSAKGMATGPVPMPMMIDARSTAASTRQVRKVWAFTSLQNCFIPPSYAKQSGWKARANFSTVSPVMELANTSHSVTEIMRSFWMAGTVAKAGFSLSWAIFSSRVVSP